MITNNIFIDKKNSDTLTHTCNLLTSLPELYLKKTPSASSRRTLVGTNHAKYKFSGFCLQCVCVCVCVSGVFYVFVKCVCVRHACVCVVCVCVCVCDVCVLLHECVCVCVCVHVCVMKVWYVYLPCTTIVAVSCSILMLWFFGWAFFLINLLAHFTVLM